jgi:hypothetical protein
MSYRAADHKHIYILSKRGKNKYSSICYYAAELTRRILRTTSTQFKNAMGTDLSKTQHASTLCGILLTFRVATSYSQCNL